MAEQLGEVVTWDCRGSCSLGAVRATLSQAGLPEDAAKDLTPAGAFGRACSKMQKERTIDKVRTENGTTLFQFTHKFLAGERFNFEYQGTVTLDNQTGDVSCPSNPELEILARQKLAEAVQVRNSHDVTMLVQKLFAKHADLYPINPRKGVAYFVPEAHREFTAKVEAFLDGLGGKLWRFPVPKGTPEGNRSVRDAVQEGLSVLLHDLNAAVEAWSDTTRESSMQKAVEQWNTISYKVDAYQEYLGAEQTRLKEELKKAKAILAARMDELASPVAA